jgi:hypothetical protein
VRRALCLLALASGLAGCGGDEEPASSGSGGSSSSKTATLSGCLELWDNDGDAHVGSTAVREVAAHSTVFAKVEIRDNLCRVAYATKARTNFGSYVQRETSYGPFALDKSDLSEAEVRKVVETANATGQSDGTLKPGRP